jgi:hypothetical protein
VVTIATAVRIAPAIPALSPTLRPVECVGTTGGELDVVEEISEVIKVLNFGFGEEAAVVVGLEGVKIVETVNPVVPTITYRLLNAKRVVILPRKFYSIPPQF